MLKKTLNIRFRTKAEPYPLKLKTVLWCAEARSKRAGLPPMCPAPRQGSNVCAPCWRPAPCELARQPRGSAARRGAAEQTIQARTGKSSQEAGVRGVED